MTRDTQAHPLDLDRGTVGLVKSSVSMTIYMVVSTVLSLKRPFRMVVSLYVEQYSQCCCRCLAALNFRFLGLGDSRSFDGRLLSRCLSFRHTEEYG